MARSKGEYLLKNTVPSSMKCYRQHAPAILSRPERVIYFLLWLFAVSYLCYSVLHASFEYADQLDSYHMGRGWSLLQRQKDKFDFEWDFWSQYLYQGWPFLAGHVVIGQLFKKYIPCKKRLKSVYMCYSILVLSVFLGLPVVLLLLLHMTIMYLCALTRSALFTALMSGVLVSTLNSAVLVHYMKEYLLRRLDEDRQYYLMLFTIAMSNLRYTSFTMEMCWYRQKQTKNSAKEATKISSGDANLKGAKEESTEGSAYSFTCLAPNSQSKQFKNSPKARKRRKNAPSDCTVEESSNNRTVERSSTSGGAASKQTVAYSFLDMVFYVFYIPLFCTGPLLTYEKFQNQWSVPWRSWNRDSVMSMMTSWVRVIFWATFCEVILHYFYFSSLMGNERILSQVSLWTLAGIGYCQGQFFMVKYVVMFGLPSCIAAFDQLKVARGPRCISAIYLYSDMWKFFDRGLYSFIKRYIYIPLGGSQCGLSRQFSASFCSFIFIYLWHGAELDLFVWTLLNFIGITMETVGRLLANSSILCHVEHYVGAAWLQRLKALSTVPLFAMSIIAIFTFFRGTSVGYIYYQRLVLNGWPEAVLTVTFFLYCCIQTSMQLKPD